MVDPTKTHERYSHRHGKPLLCVRWSWSGDAIYFSAENSPPQRFFPSRDGAEPRLVGLIGGHDSWVSAMAVLPDNRTVVTAGYDGRLVWFDVAAETPAVLRVRDAHAGWVRAVAASPDGRRLVSCGNDCLIRLWDAVDGSEQAVLSGHDSHVYEVAWRPDGATVASCDLKGVVKEWDVTKCALHRDVVTASALWKYDTTFRADIGGARSICFDTIGNQLALGGITKVTNAFAGVGKPVIVLVDWLQPPATEGGEGANGKVGVRMLEGKDAGNGVCWGVAWHSAGFWIGQAGGGGGGWLRFFQADAENEVHALKLPANGRGMALSPDEKELAIASADGHLRVYALHE